MRSHLSHNIQQRLTGKENNSLGLPLTGTSKMAMSHFECENMLKQLKQLQYKQTIFPQYSPHEYHPIKWTNKRKTPFEHQEDTSDFLSPKETVYIQSVVSTFLYYARAIYSSMLPALNQIGAQQSQTTKKTEEKYR